MKHALRKYISPCGSALFMVVSTMAALIVLVTAMYMSVLSSRQVQFATFDQEQAYVTSTSIADIICSYIADGKNSGNAFVKNVVGLENVGDSISTNGNGFASLSDSGTLDDTLLGGYDVTVTKQKDETISGTTWHVYDVAVTVSNNGILETTHTFLRTKDPEPDDMPDIDRFFTATGYVPNDVLVSAINLNSTAYYDSEFVRFGDIESGYNPDNKPNTVTIRSGLICAGSVEFDKGNNLKIDINEPTDWYIGNNMTVKPGGTVNFSLGGSGAVESSKDRGRIFIGGDLNINTTTNIGSDNKPTDVYVLGDVNISATFTMNGNLYVAGNVNITDIPQAAVFYGQSKIYHTGKTINIQTNPYNSSLVWLTYNGGNTTLDDVLANRWDTITTNDISVSLTDVSAKLDTAIGASVYYKWYPDIDDAKANVRNIIFNGYYEAVDVAGIEVVKDSGDLVPMSTYKPYNKEIGSLTEVAPKRVEYIDSDCTIGDIVDIGQAGIGPHTIIFDTGAAGNVLTINLQANMCLNGSDEPNGFAWGVAYAESDVLDPHTDEKLTDSQPGQAMTVLTVGDGTLVLNVPDGVTYQAADYEFLGHYAWFKLTGGDYDTATGAYIANISDSDVSTVQSMIHDADGCTSCVYEPKKNSDGEDGFTCTVHGGFIEGTEKPSSCVCTGRVEKDKFTGDKYLYDGLPQKANVNIFIVSCDESADIQIGCLKYETGEKKSVRDKYFGYVYAPYMTYMDMSDSNGHGLKCCGGLIVSDYVMSGYYDYVFALPDVSLREIIGDDYLATPNANRTWRVHGV